MKSKYYLKICALLVFLVSFQVNARDLIGDLNKDILKCNHKKVRLFIKKVTPYGAYINEEDDNGKTPLDYAHSMVEDNPDNVNCIRILNLLLAYQTFLRFNSNLKPIY